jgi:hypothetical protein
MKIFEINYKDKEKQWVAANTNIEALQEVLSIESTDLDMMEEIIEIPDSKYDEMNVVNNDYDETDEDDWESKTFRDFIKDYTKPVIISATFYDA